MASFADISIRFGADLKGFSTQMQNAQRSLNKTAASFRKIGAGLTLGVTTPLLALGAAAVKNFDVQAKAVAQVEQGLISTGNAVGYNTEQLKKMAGALQENTLFGDENILKNVTSQLLTFTNITGREFERTQQAALDLATRLDGDLKSASIQLGKALNDPILGLSALAKSGIQFSKDQKTLINSLVEGGKIAEAQGLILDELAKQYGGSAAAAAKAGLGPFTQLKNILGDITEEFGGIILEGLNPIIESVKELALGFTNLSPETKKFLVVFGGIAAAVGPLLALAGTILPAIGTGFAILTGPIGLIAAGLTAIGVIIYKNWAPIKETLIEIANYFIDLYNESTLFRAVVEGISINFKNILAVGKFVFGTLGDVISAVAENIKNGFQPLGALIKAVLTGDIKSIPTILAAGFTQGFEVGKGLISDINKDFQTLKGVISTNIEEGLNNALRGKKYELLSDNVEVEGVTEKVADAVKKGLDEGLKQGPAGRPQLARLDLDVRGLTEVGTLDIGEQIGASLQVEEVSEKTAQLLEKMIEFREGARDILENAAQDFISGFAQIVGAIASGNAGFSDLGGFLLNTVGTVLVNLGRLAIQVAVTIEGIKKALKTLNPVVAAIAGAAAIALGTFIRNQASSFAGNFASGGIVPGSSFSGDKLIAGVNSGELILNVAQQKALAGALVRSNQVVLQPSLEYTARGFRVMLNEVDNYNNRTS